MVRFSWHVEDGLQAYLPPGAYTVQKDNSVRHAACEIEIPQSKETLEALLTLPPNYLDADKVKETGVVLGHGDDAEEWNGKLLTEIAVFLASHGYVVIRYYCKHKEQRRQRMFEKALDACATSPYARGVTQWVLAGFGSGGRVAAVVGSRCRGNIAGFVMLSYPLKEVIPQPAAKPRRGEDDLSPLPKSSESPLFTLDKPILFCLGDSDALCPAAELKATASQLPSPDIRAELFEDADQDFKSVLQGKGPASSVMRRLCACILDFVTALAEDSLAACSLAKAADLPVEAAASREPISASAEGNAKAEEKLPEASVTPRPEAVGQRTEQPMLQPEAQPGKLDAPQQLPAGAPTVARPAPGLLEGSKGDQQEPPPAHLPQLYQQMLNTQMLPHSQQARQVLQALAQRQLQGSGFQGQPQPGNRHPMPASLQQVLMQNMPTSSTGQSAQPLAQNTTGAGFGHHVQPVSGQAAQIPHSAMQPPSGNHHP